MKRKQKQFQKNRQESMEQRGNFYKRMEAGISDETEKGNKQLEVVAENQSDDEGSE